MSGARITRSAEGTACAACGTVLAPAGQSWKSSARVTETPMTGVGGSAYAAAEGVVLRRFACGTCGALLDSETALPGDPFLDDKVA